MGVLNRIFLFLFSLLALAIGLIGCAIFVGITSLEFIDTQQSYDGTKYVPNTASNFLSIPII